MERYDTRCRTKSADRFEPAPLLLSCPIPALHRIPSAGARDRSSLSEFDSRLGCYLVSFWFNFEFGLSVIPLSVSVDPLRYPSSGGPDPLNTIWFWGTLGILFFSHRFDFCWA
ncbi:hypothetical protein GW17_00040200 [Ensete ventricosum]|nr:hypothetical protein GW17_00040200 [Ensete ventricosum]